jgi:hypothetical protein
LYTNTPVELTASFILLSLPFLVFYLDGFPTASYVHETPCGLNFKQDPSLSPSALSTKTKRRKKENI